MKKQFGLTTGKSRRMPYTNQCSGPSASTCAGSSTSSLRLKWNSNPNIRFAKLSGSSWWHKIFLTSLWTKSASTCSWFCCCRRPLNFMSRSIALQTNGFVVMKSSVRTTKQNELFSFKRRSFSSCGPLSSLKPRILSSTIARSCLRKKTARDVTTCSCRIS